MTPRVPPFKVRGVRMGWYNFRNGTAERTVISRNGTLIPTLCLTLP